MIEKLNKENYELFSLEDKILILRAMPSCKLFTTLEIN